MGQEVKTAGKPEIEMTDEYKKIIQTIQSGHPATFISGKAGSGKTTLLHFMTSYFEKAKKNIALVAPTGIAALQAGGATIHSFFRFRYGALNESTIRVPSDPALYKLLDILFIDEVSMVRADMMDAIDIFLRKARRNSKPFGGCQVVFIGDLFQLPPVVTKQDGELLSEMGYVNGTYFFNAKVFTKIAIKNIELTKIFRQKDIDFMNILNKVRVAEDSRITTAELNKKCLVAGKKPHPLAITLATTNAIADEKNQSALASLTTPASTFFGRFEKDFKMDGKNLPSPDELVLKVGAMVMFTANEKDEKRWVNGMLGKVVHILKDSVDVQISNGKIVNVERNEWKSYEYQLVEGKIKQKETGSYWQLPLTLGWAVTIHKSQGKTLEFLHIDLGYGAFATGQVYVALSRAVNIDGMTFEKPIRESDIKCCPLVKAFFEPEEFALTA